MLKKLQIWCRVAPLSWGGSRYPKFEFCPPHTQAKILETHSTVHRVGLKLHQSDQVGFKDGVQPEKEANFANPCQEEKRRKLCCRIFSPEEVSSKIVEY